MGIQIQNSSIWKVLVKWGKTNSSLIAHALAKHLILQYVDVFSSCLQNHSQLSS